MIHLRDRFAANTPDVEWLGALSGPWVVVSIDRFTKNNAAERAAIRMAGHTVFVLHRQWSEQGFWLQAERIVKWWPQILQQSRLVAADAFSVPWHHRRSSKFEQIRL